MHNWLVEQADVIKWRKFFVFKRDGDLKALKKIESHFGCLPTDYKDFVLRFGDAKLFRHLRRGSYQMAVFSHPRLVVGIRDDLLLEVGFFINGGYAHFRKSNSSPDIEPGIFEGTGRSVRKAADSFDDWLKKRFERCRKLYSQEQWRRILKGAAPFTEEERQLVEAIQRFSFEQVGVAKNGDCLIKVHNGSSLSLKFLTVGARAKGRLEGTVFLDVSRIGPGESAVIEHDCYKSQVPADKIELFRKPVPDPEDREFYHEFGRTT